MSYGFSMGFAQAKNFSEAMSLAHEYVDERMKLMRIVQELERNVYFAPTVRAGYTYDQNTAGGEPNWQLKYLAETADRYWIKSLFSYRFLYWEEQQLLGIVMMEENDASDKWPLYVYFQNSSDQDYPYADWEAGNIPFFTDAVSKAKALTVQDIVNLYPETDVNSRKKGYLEYLQRSWCYKYIFDTLGFDSWLYGSDSKSFPYKCFELNGINSEVELYRCHHRLKRIISKTNATN